MSRLQVELSCDIGEGYGRWRLADDAAFMPFVSTVNIACGFHAGDARTMRDTVDLAIANGLQIGAHVGLPDLQGFGRRRMTLTMEEMRDYTIYQVGALRAFVESAGGTIDHVKPHGVMYTMIQEEESYADAVIAAIAEIDPSMLLYALDERHAERATASGIELVPEGFVDLHYTATGELLIERVKNAREPAEIAARAVRLVTEGVVRAADGQELSLSRRTICLHSDGPNSIEVVRAVHEALTVAGVDVVALRSQRAAIG